MSAECSILMKGNALKRTSLLVWASGDARVELFRLDSVVGGLSGFLGEAEEDDSSFSSWQIFFVFSFTDESLLTETSFFAKCFSEPGVTSSHTDVEDDLFTAG